MRISITCLLAGFCIAAALPERQLTTSSKNHNLDNNDNFDLFPGRRANSFWAVYDTRGTAVPNDGGGCVQAH